MNSSETKQYSEDNIIIIKGRFKSAPMNLYGQFLVIFNNNKQFESYNIVVSTFSDAYELEPHLGWDKFEESIINMKWKGNFNASMTSSLMDQFKKLAEDYKGVELLFDNAYNYDYDNMDITLYDMINRIIHDKNLVLETGIQELSQEEFLRTKENRGKNKETQEEPRESEPSEFENQLAEGSVILPIKAIVAPVRGKSIYELKIGDKIMVRILPNSDRANYFIDLLGLRDDTQRDEKKIKPTPAEVIDIKKGSAKREPVEILVEIGPGLYGKLVEDEQQIRLKMYNPQMDGPVIKKELGPYPGNADGLAADMKKPALSKGSIILLALFLAILILFLVLIFLSW
jgi:hypothetical protein